MKLKVREPEGVVTTMFVVRPFRTALGFKPYRLAAEPLMGLLKTIEDERVLVKTLTVALPLLAETRSGRPSPFKSAVATA